MSIKISGTYRIQNIYVGDKQAYLTLKDKGDNSISKIGFVLPLPAGVVDDGLVSVEGALIPRVYQNNMGLTFQGLIKPVEVGK